LEGDADVYNLGDDAETSILCRRAHLHCNGLKVCQYFDMALLENFERYEPDVEAMQELWNHELDANEREASSRMAILAR
jgi:hypothetical protein